MALCHVFSKQLAISSRPYLNMLAFLPYFSIRMRVMNKCLCIPVRYAHVNAIIITANNLSILSWWVRCVSSTLNPLYFMALKHLWEASHKCIIRKTKRLYF